jgi:hypothetical protein
MGNSDPVSDACRQPAPHDGAFDGDDFSRDLLKFDEAIRATKSDSGRRLAALDRGWRQPPCRGTAVAAQGYKGDAAHARPRIRGRPLLQVADTCLSTLRRGDGVRAISMVRRPPSSEP